MSDTLTKRTVTPSEVEVTADMTISEIIEKVPQASTILADFQLGCAGCVLGSYETLRDGVMGHGLTEVDVQEILEQIQSAASTPRVFIDVAGIEFTEEAYDKVHEFIRCDVGKRKNLALRLDVIQTADSFQYFFDLVTKKKKGEKELKQANLRIFVTDENFEHFQDKYIDFQETAFGAGFKVEKRLDE